VKSAILPDVRWPEQAAIALVAAPVALFLATWFQPLLGFPAAAITGWTAWRAAKSVAPSPLPSFRAIGILVLVALVWTWISGLGGFFQQLDDHNFRNALLHDLIDNSWPVVWQTPAGTVALDYNLAWSLLPSLVGKVLGWRAATLAMAMITAIGAFLVLLIFARVVGTWRWWLPALFLLWSGMDIVGWGLRGRFPWNTHFIENMENWCFPPVWFQSNMLNYLCTSHLAVPTWIIVLLLVGRRIGPSGILGFSALLFPLAPYQMLGLTPFLAWAVLQGEGSLSERLRKAFTLENICLPIVVLALCAPFYLGNVGAGQGSGWFFERSPSSLPPWVILVAFVLVEFLVVGVAVWMTGLRDRLLLLALLVLCLIPLRQSGLSNDLALKASMPGLTILTFFTAKALLSKTKALPRWFLISLLALGACTPLHEVWEVTRWTLKDLNTLEEDHIRTFDPTRPPNPIFTDYVANFRSRPLEDLPLLRWMLAD
jgi:hypothetical protein